MAKKRPAFQFYASDWLGSNKHAMMTPAQRGAYIDLLCYQWNDPDCTLPDDDQLLATMSGLGEGWFNGGSALLRLCFPPAEGKAGRVANPRLLEVKADADEWSRKSAIGGKRSGEVRRAKAEEAKAYAASKSHGSDEEDAKGGSTNTPTIVEPKGEPIGNTPPSPPSPSSPPTSASSPAPSPTSDTKGLASAKPSSGKPDRSADIRAVVAHYQTFHPKAQVPGKTSKTWRAITARLEEGYTVENLEAAISGNHRSPYHSGENDRHTKYQSLELIVRDSEHVVQFMEIPESGREPTDGLTAMQRRGVGHTQRFLDGETG